MDIQLTSAHWIYLVGIIVILITMVLRKNIVVPAVTATFLTAWAFSGSLITGLSSIFNASLVVAEELFNIFLIIALVTAMLGALREMGADRLMIAPFRKVMRAGTSSFIVLAVVTYLISLLFWPTPAVPLVGAVLIPVAIRAGLTPLSVGMVVAIAGQGMALSSDYIIKVAPEISAKAAGVGTEDVAGKGLVLSLTVGLLALLITYLMERRTWRKPSAELLEEWEKEGEPTSSSQTSPHGERGTDSDETSPAAETATRGSSAATTITRADVAPTRPRSIKAFAVLVPVIYFAFVCYLLLGEFSTVVPPLRGGAAAAIIGGIASLVLFAAAFANDRRNFLETSSEHVIDGLVFAFKAMGIVLPIAGFFFLGNGEFSAAILGLPDDVAGPSILFDLINAGQAHLSPSPVVTAFGILLIGLIAGLEGSGFSGLPLTGSLSGALGPTVGMDPATLAAIGQMGNIWAGGGTLVAWSSLVAVAGFARVPVLDLARRCFLPVMAGLIVSTVFAIMVF
jgi:hypothetical protein